MDVEILVVPVVVLGVVENLAVVFWIVDCFAVVACDVVGKTTVEVDTVEMKLDAAPVDFVTVVPLDSGVLTECALEEGEIVGPDISVDFVVVIGTEVVEDPIVVGILFVELTVVTDATALAVVLAVVGIEADDFVDAEVDAEVTEVDVDVVEVVVEVVVVEVEVIEVVDVVGVVRVVVCNSRWKFANI